METTKKQGGKIRRGWELTKSSWRVLKLDKELVALPVFSFMASFFVLLVFVTGIVAYRIHDAGGVVDSSSSATSNVPLWLMITSGLALYFLLTLIANIFSGAIIHAAIERFKGGDPTARRSLRAAMRKFRPLALFSLLMATVGFVLQALEERVPFVGAIALWLLNAAWSIANVFAVPIIVMSDKNVAPLTATKESVKMIRKVWAKGVVAQFGISLIAMLTVTAYALVWAAAGAGLYALSHSAVAVVILSALALIGLMALALVFTTLSSIMKAGLYYYATTGESPEGFNQELLRSAMTPKKARKIFA